RGEPRIPTWPELRSPAVPRPLEGLWVFAAAADAVQLTWRRSAPGQVRLSVGDRRHVVDVEGGPGAGAIGGLEPDRTYEIGVDGQRRTTVRTLTAAPGPELLRFATISDLHVGETSFGYFGTMREHPAPLVPYSVRATRAALAELREWGAEL